MSSDYKKIASRGLKSARQIGAEMKASATGKSRKPRTLADHAKASPADASGKGQIGYNLHSMGRAK